MRRRKRLLHIAACTLSILLITEGISGVPAIAFAAGKDLVEETIVETDADEAVFETDEVETVTSYETVDDALFLDINEDVSEFEPCLALPEGDGDYVTGANTVIDRIGLEGYDEVTADSMELYTAFEADLNLEIQGGRYFKGHEILNFSDSDIKVYDKTNYEALTDGEDSTVAVPKAEPYQFNTSMVFALNEIPVEMSDNYMLFVPDEDPEGEDASYLEKVKGTALYAWEYEKQTDGTYKRVCSVPISGEDFMINDENDTMYVNLYLGHIDTDKRSFDELQTLGTYSAPKIHSYLSEHPDVKKDYYQHVPTLSGLVRLDGSDFNDSSNPIAIAALCYDATTTPEEDLYTTPSTESTGGYIYHDYSWDNNKGFALTFAVSDEDYYYGRRGEVNYTKYWSDEPYYASKMGSFSLQPYKYRFTDTETEHTLTLYNVYPYTLFVRRIQENYHVNYDNWKDEKYSQANLLIDTWKIPAAYTDPLSGTVYNVRIAKGGNIVPQFASKLIIEDGVGFPDDCSYLFSSTASVNLRCLSEIVIQGDAKSVGSNITNMSYMFLGKQGRQGLDATTYKSLDFAALDTSNVTDMSYLFADVTMTNRANIDVTTLDTSKVTDFKGMFRSYHVPSVLYQPVTALDLSHFNTESAEDMSEMFEGSTVSSLDLSYFDFSKVTDMSGMFTFTEYLESITFPANMDSSKVTDMSFMFAGDYNLTQINNITAMDTGSVTDMSGMFGAHKCNKKQFETIPVNMDPDVYEGSYQYDKHLDGFAVFNPAWVTAELFNVNDGPTITSLDLTGFDTRKVKYANGMFYMPALTEIKWGTNTTFESLSDAGGMFTLASVKTLDLTGRRFSNLKFASSQAFPVEMFNLNQATELVLGENSINLSDLSSKGQLMINAPELYSLDLRDVEMGANALAGEGALYYQSPGSLQGLSGLYEIYLPAGMPLLASPAELHGTFYDDDGAEYTVINGGYENDLHLVNPESEVTVAITGIRIVNDANKSTIIAGDTLSLRAVLSPKEATGAIMWTSDKPDVATVDQTGLVTGVAPGKALITAASGNGVKATYSITVQPAPVPDEMNVTKVTLNKTAVSLYPGDSFKLSATVSPAGARDKSVTWGSSDGSGTYAELDDTGLITARSADVDGSGDPIPATVTITAAANGAAAGTTVKAECIVTVLPSEIVDKGDDDNSIQPAAGQAFVPEGEDGSGEAKVWVAGLDTDGYFYTGNAIKPSIHVYKGYKLLKSGTDYTLKYKNNKNVSTGVTSNSKKPQIIIKMKGAYSGSKTVYFEILPMPLEKLAASGSVGDPVVLHAVYKAGKKNQLKPALVYDNTKVKYGKKDVMFKWYTTDEEGNVTDTTSTCIEPGTYAVKIFAGTSGNVSAPADTGKHVATIIVDGKPLMSSVKISGFKSKLAYKGGEAVTQPADLKLTYTDKSGKHQLIEWNEAESTGDYTVTYKNNYEPGTATVIYEAVKDEQDEYTGAFRGKIVKTYKITGKSVIKEAEGDELNVGECKITLGTETDDDKYTFTNAQIKPSVTVTAKIINNEGAEEEITLRSGKDYTLTYKNNKAVAADDAKKKGKDIAPQVVIKGKGNYVFGTTKNAGIVKRFTIVPADLNDLILTISDRVYSKKANDYKKTKILFTDRNYKDLKLKAGRGKDYTVTYETSDRSSAPIAGQVVTVTITGNNDDSLTGTGSYKGEVKGSYRITDKKKHKDINKASAVVNPNSKGKSSACIYTGSGIEPGRDGQPVLKLTYGSGKSRVTLTEKTAANPDGDYEILGYFNNVNKGSSAVVLIRGTGDTFRGVRAVKFKIAARGVNTRWGGVYGQ